jgi:hypothetical protein
VKLLPYAGGVLMLMMLMFAIYVRNVPPKQKVVLPQPVKAKDDKYMEGFKQDVIRQTEKLMKKEKMEKQKAQAEPPVEPAKPSFAEPDTIEL